MTSGPAHRTFGPESDAARQAITVGRELSDEILGHLVEVDSPTQAPAKAAKRRGGPAQAGAVDEPSNDGALDLMRVESNAAGVLVSWIVSLLGGRLPPLMRRAEGPAHVGRANRSGPSG